MEVKMLAFVAVVPVLMTGCLGGGSGSSSGQAQTDLSVSEPVALKTSPVLFQLAQASSDQRFSQVIVNVKDVEVIIGKGAQASKVLLSQNLGPVDLTQLAQGIKLNLASLEIPEGVFIREIRLKLHNEGHFAVDQMGQTCMMQTPSAQQSGLKLKLSDHFEVQAGYSYKIAASFNTNKAIVLQGNGDCLLKPVIRLSEATKQLVVDPVNPENPTPEVPVEPEEPVNPEDPEMDPEIPYDPIPGEDYIIDGDTVLILQDDGSYLVIEGVNLELISIEEILAIYG